MSKIQSLAIILFVVAGTATLYVNLTSNDSSSGGMVSKTPDMSGLVNGDPIVSVKLPAKLSPQEQIGKRAFNAVCAACHGKNAAGKFGFGPPFVNRIYEPSHHGDLAFLSAARNGVRSHHWPFGNMPPQKGLTKGDIANIVAYVRALQRANGIN